MNERAARTGELCTCGRQASVVYVHDDGRKTGYCGRADGGKQTGPCPFCGAPERHRTAWGDPEKCPDYRLTPATSTDK